MKLKLDDDGNAVLQDGMPVYIHDDGKESPFDAGATVAAIKARNAEAKSHRERAESAEAKLQAFDGIDDAEAARKALALAAKLDQSKLIDAGQVDAVKAEINKVWEGKLSEAEQRAQALEAQLHGEIVGGSFARSKFIAEKLAIPADIVQSAFGSRFSVEGGKLKATDADGNPIYSRKNAGAPADFDEALEILVDQYPHRDSLLKADQRSGSGAPANGSGQPGKQKINRASFEALDPLDRTGFLKGGGVVTD